MERVRKMTEKLEGARPPKTKTPPRPPVEPPVLPLAGGRPRLPPILDPSRKSEVRAMVVRVAGSMVITCVGLFSVLTIKDSFDWETFLVLLAFFAKDPLMDLVSFLTGAKAARLEIVARKKEDDWAAEREKMRMTLTEANITIAKLEKELEAERYLRENVAARPALPGPGHP